MDVNSVNKLFEDLPSAASGWASKIVGTINSVLTMVFGSLLLPYAILLISFIAGWFLRQQVVKNSRSFVWYLVLSFLVFMTLRYGIGIGG